MGHPDSTASNSDGETITRIVTQYMFKVLVIGAAGTGKTSSIRRFVNDEFADNYQATIGVDFAVKTIQYDDDIVVKLQLWDIAGQERYSSMTRVYFKEATGALLVYDMTNPDSFDAIQRWKSDLDSKVTLPDSLGGGSIPAVLLANKSDLTPATQGLPPQQSTRQLDQYCTENGYLDWFPTSAKENTNLDEAARCLVHHLLQLMRQAETTLDASQRLGPANGGPNGELAGASPTNGQVNLSDGYQGRFGMGGYRCC